jgi:hypothetical protein
VTLPDVRFRLLRFFPDLQRPSRIVELDHTILLGRADDLAEHLRPLRGLRQHGRQARAIEDVVAEDQRDRGRADEIGPDDEGIGEAARRLLCSIGETHADFGPITEQALEQRLVCGVEMMRMSRMPAAISVDSG